MKRKRKQVSKKNDIQNMLRLPQLWIGVCTIIFFFAMAIAFITFVSVKNNTVNPDLENNKQKNEIMKNDTFMKNEKVYTVIENDNFWKISEKNCGTGKYFLGIQRRNGYDNNWRALRAGESITILCEE